MTKKNNCATVILTAVCGLFAFVPTVDAAGWRVIAEDPKFPTDDVIVAFCSVTDPQYKLPADPAKSDCTPAIQRALDDASAAGGGTVFLPEGRYRLEGMLTIASNVVLRGRWSLIGPDRPAEGTILMIHNQEHEQSVLLTGGSGCGVRDLTFWHPDQQISESTDSKSLAESPLVIRGQAGFVTIENITLINPCRGIDLSRSSACCLRGIYGSPLHCGLSADRSFAVSRYDSIHFSPDYWTWSKLPGSPPKGGAHADYMRKHGTGLHIYEMDGFYAGFSKISGYQKGLHFERGASGDDASGALSYTSVTDCDTALHVDDAKGFTIVGCILQGSKYGIWGKDRTHYLTHTTSIEGGERSISIRNGTAELVNCTLTGETEILGHRTKYLRHQYDEKLPPFQNSYDRVRKPTKADLFNVKDYGAVGDRTADDTQALKKAIEAASANGGGIVFVPDGEYRITEELNLGNGVELRGNSGGRHIVCNKRGSQLGSVLFIETGEGDENGTALLTMGDGSGLRGIGFYYPNQNYKSFKKYPYMVRANGKKNYVIDCSAPNPYQGLELNGDDHLVEYSFFGGLRRTYRANHCSGGRIQNCHIKPDFWRDVWLPGCPKTAELGEFKNRVNEAYEPIYLNGCDNYVVMSIFNHASHTMMTVDDSSGQALTVGGEQLQQGYAFKNGAKTFDLISSGCNINHIGGRDGTYGIKTFPGFKGEARFYCSLAMGTSDETWNAQGGHLFCQLTSITGPSNRGANSIHCGPGATITVQSGGCGSHHLGFEDQGQVSFRDFRFGRGFLRSAATKFQADNHIEKVYVLFDANQPVPKGYGLKLDQSNIRMEDALIAPNTGFARKDSRDGRRLPAARLTEGNSYSLDVTDPGFQNGSFPEVEITLYFRVDTTCSIRTFYRSKNGMKLGDTVDFELKDKPFWKEHRFRVSDAHFDSDEDLRIEVEGASPLLAMVVIAAPQERRQAAVSVHLDEEKPFRAAEAGFEISRNDLLSGVRFQSNLELQNGTDFGMTDGLGEEPKGEDRVFADANQKNDPWVVEFSDLRIQRLDEIRVFSWNRDTRARQNYDLELSRDGGSTWQSVVAGVTTKNSGILTVTRVVASFDEVTNLRFTFYPVRNNTHSAILEIDALGEKIPDPTVESVLAALEEPLDFKKHVSPIFDRYCLQCHEGDDPNGDMDIGGLDPDVVHGADTLRWHAMLDALNRGEMPPSDMSQPKNEERLLLVGWLTQELEKAAEHKRGEIVSLPRRLTKTQYRNTLNDLLGLDLDFGAELPDEGVSADGFQNNAEVLTVSALQTEYYMKIAREALGKAIMLDRVPEIQHFQVEFGKNINPDINPNKERVVLGFKGLPQKPVDYRYREVRLKKPFEYHLHRRRTNYIFNEGWNGNNPAPHEKEFHDIFHSVMVDFRNGQGKFELLDSGIRLEPANAYVAGTRTAPTLKVVIREFPREGDFAIRVRASLAPGASKGLPDEAMPLIHGYLGNRRDDAETFDLAGEPLRMTKRDGIQEFQFVDRLEKMPLPTWEPESRNFLSNLAHVGTFNVIPEELNQGQRVIVHAMAFEAPYFEEYPPKSHQRIFVSEEPREILERFLTRAWRRPPTDDELTLMLGFQKEIRETDHPDSFEASILETLVIALSSPQFLYIHEPVPDGKPRPLTDYELASRLSYFLWNTMPDEELLRMASRNELRGKLDSQIDRMLADERSWDFIGNFVDQWLDVSRMDRVVVQRRREWTPEVAKDAKAETIYFFAELLRSNGSLLELIDSDWVMTNQNLAQFYRDLEDAEIKGDDFRRVSLPDNHRRGGVLTHASILTGHSSGVDSHPVKRGVWLTKRVLATPPPPAPPGVPPLDEEDPELQKLSIRKQLELHRDNAACSNCHQRIDPWGVAMEEFDTIGKYRRRDATAVLPNGDTIAGMEGLKAWLLENRKRDVTRSVVRHLTAWALGRSLSFADDSLIDEMVNEVEADKYRIQTAIRAIVQSKLFLNR